MWTEVETRPERSVQKRGDPPFGGGEGQQTGESSSVGVPGREGKPEHSDLKKKTFGRGITGDVDT